MDRKSWSISGGVLGLIALAIGTVAVSTADPSPRRGAAPPARVTDSPAPTEPPAPPALLPNLRSLDAFDIAVEGVGRQRRLRFAASLANLGPGPLVLKPRGRGQCGPREHSAVQVVFADADGDGRYRRGRDDSGTSAFTGCMLRHPGHDHWHFDAMTAYSLRRPAATNPVVTCDKVSFCLRDNERVPGAPVVVRREHFGECSRQGRQGISPGWVDVYGADLDGQWLRLPRGLDGEVACLDLAADPSGLVDEADETDNATSVALRISASGVRRVDAGQRS